MTHKIHDIGVAKQIGAYSDAYEVAPNARWLFSSGTAGLSLDEVSAYPFREHWLKEGTEDFHPLEML